MRKDHEKLKKIFEDYRILKLKESFQTWRNKIFTFNKKIEIKIPFLKIPSTEPIIRHKPEPNIKNCPGCKRSFNPIPYIKHIKICSILNLKRKPFDSRRQRIINNEHALYIRKLELLKNAKKLTERDDNLKSRWKKTIRKTKNYN